MPHLASASESGWKLARQRERSDAHRVGGWEPHRHPLNILASVVTLVTLTGCTDWALRTETRLPAARPAAAEVAPNPAPTEHTQALTLPGFLPAVLFVPAGSDSRPLVVAAHGAGGAPEWDCEYWVRRTFGHAFVLCLRGTQINAHGGYYFRDHHALNAELTAAVAAARQGFSRIALTSGIYAGFSQGASMGSLILDKHADEFPYVVLIEGFQQLNVALGSAFAQRGGKAVLFACGSRECAKAADSSRHALERAGVRARAEHAAGAGHTAGGAVEALVAQGIEWMLASDPAWTK